MRENKISTTEKEWVLSNQLPLVELQNALKELKDEFSLPQEKEAELYDAALYQLTEKIWSLLEQQAAWNQENLANYPDLVKLMREIVHEVHYGKIDRRENTFTLSEEKKLLLELMYSVLAKIWRQEQERIVRWYTQEAVSFFQKLWVSKLYAFLVAKAK